MLDFAALAQAAAPYIIERRRYYHAHPELSGEERETCRAIRADLEALDIQVRPVAGCHGLIGTLEGSAPGRTVALRADIDALPISEGTGFDFASRNPGVMHACGHDAHIAMLLGAARLLAGCRESLRGTVRFLIQPEEEHVTGAAKLAADGALDGVDAVFGAHVWDAVDSSQIDVSPGPRMAATTHFNLRIRGRAAHGAAPHQGIDAVVAACAVVQALQTIVSRETNPLEPLVITVGTIHGGAARNIIANEVTLGGTIRYYAEALDPCARVRAVAGRVAAIYGATAEMELLPGARPVVNDDEALNRIARDAVTAICGEAGLGSMPPTMTSEDFSVYQSVPSLFAFVGSHCEEKGLVFPNHHECYTVDEDALPRGAAFLAKCAFDFLAQDAPPPGEE